MISATRLAVLQVCDVPGTHQLRWCVCGPVQGVWHGPVIGWCMGEGGCGCCVCAPVLLFSGCLFSAWSCDASLSLFCCINSWVAWCCVSALYHAVLCRAALVHRRARRPGLPGCLCRHAAQTRACPLSSAQQPSSCMCTHNQCRTCVQGLWRSATHVCLLWTQNVHSHSCHEHLSYVIKHISVGCERHAQLERLCMCFA